MSDALQKNGGPFNSDRYEGLDKWTCQVAANEQQNNTPSEVQLTPNLGDSAADGALTDVPHGMPPGFKSPSGYINHGCRCDECKAAASAYFGAYHRKHPRVLRSRRLVVVTCTKCEWRGRRDAKNGWDQIAIDPCPRCGSEVA